MLTFSIIYLLSMMQLYDKCIARSLERYSLSIIPINDEENKFQMYSTLTSAMLLLVLMTVTACHNNSSLSSCCTNFVMP
jgi:hypothetical protein